MMQMKRARVSLRTSRDDINAMLQLPTLLKLRVHVLFVCVCGVHGIRYCAQDISCLHTFKNVRFATGLAKKNRQGWGIFLIRRRPITEGNAANVAAPWRVCPC